MSSNKSQSILYKVRLLHLIRWVLFNFQGFILAFIANYVTFPNARRGMLEIFISFILVVSKITDYFWYNGSMIIIPVVQIMTHF